MNNNGRPITMRKKVQLLLALTILAWATQTLFAQWARAEAAAFVPRGNGAVAGGTLELRSEARIYGAEAKLKQICRWPETDAAMFAPVADVVLARLDQRRPYKVITLADLRETLEQAGINVARVRFSGPLECTVSRTDLQLKEGEALEQWIKSQDESATGAGVSAVEPAAQLAAAQLENAAEDPAAGTLRRRLISDLASRLALPEDHLVISFDPRDESALNLPEPQFKFNIDARQAKDLGRIAWDVAIVGPSGSRKAQIRASARAWQNQVVASKPLSRGKLMQAEDVTARRTLIEKMPDAAPLLSEQVVGQMASRDVKPGVVLTAELVEAVPLAKTGQFITVTLERGTVRVKSVAKAMEGGCYGQTIRVKNESTKDVYQVILTGPQEATMAAS